MEIGRILAGQEYEVIVAPDGREGLRLLLEFEVDVAIVNPALAGMDGPTFLGEARKIWPWLGVVILVDQPGDELADLRRMGVVRRLEKPFASAGLIEAIRSESVEKRRRSTDHMAFTPNRVQAQIGILRHLSEMALESGSLVEALQGLSRGMVSLLPCTAVGVLAEEDDTHTLVLNMPQPVDHAFLEKLREEVRDQYASLTGELLDPDSFEVQIDGEAISDMVTTPQGQTFTVPVIVGSEIHGLLIVASDLSQDYNAEDISFLYHAANHLSTTFAAIHQMRKLAIHDSLTGVYNRKRLDEELDLSWNRCRRYGHAMSVAMLDLDRFKQLNDRYGHQFGDDILREFAAVIQKCARNTDIVGRYGGDELAVVLPEGGLVAARTFGERLMDAVHHYDFGVNPSDGALTVSIGIATSDNAGKPASGTELLAQADEALLRAKRQGRNQIVVWTQNVSTENGKAMVSPTARECKGSVLIVDDEPGIAETLCRILTLQGFHAQPVFNAAAAVDTLTGSPRSFDVVVTDLQMPGSDGFELLDQLARADNTIVKIVITGHATKENAVNSLRHGAYDFVEKPIATEQLIRILDRALEYRRLTMENVRYHAYLEEMVRARSTELTGALDDLTVAYDFTLEALVKMLDAREHATGKHSVRVRDLAMLLARGMGLTDPDLETIARGAFLHDIGKIAVPDRILLKPGPLEPNEMILMRRHVETGYEVLRSSEALQGAAEIVRSHHEWFDGSGYPSGMQGEEICLGARIFSVVDAYDAMRSNRPYRDSMSPDAAQLEIRKGSGTQFDPDVVRNFLESIEGFEAIGNWSAPVVV